jgi:threonine dehydratase
MSYAPHLARYGVPVRVDGIRAAHRAIDPVFLDTPLFGHEAADAELGAALLAKVETLNPIRSFKGRGTDWFVQSLSRVDAPIVTASAGNFGQGIARAARRYGHRALVFAAETANPLKVEAMRRLGAEVRLTGADFDAAKSAARAFAREAEALFVEDGDVCAVAEGAGTIALELVRELEHRGAGIDIVLVPLGNGALLTGMGTYLKAALPSCRVVGIVAAGAPAMLESWREGRIVTTARADTIADGIAVREPVAYALDSMRGTVDDVWVVEDDAIRAAMRFCHRHFGLVVEPAGAAGVAAALDRRDALRGQRVATVLCGGNLTPEQMTAYLG